ncbi:MAG: hypothetical protein ACTTJK_10425 [Phocaeicola sp.]|uniref:hypothetical protein n=1 Tax=Phocaeicola TaxID=909656 RepID=UPI00234F9FE4|nr:hypothetical protein [Phocaeicola oris]MCE2616359.1 hypothetical protein [Phocaeicola oris]
MKTEEIKKKIVRYKWMMKLAWPVWLVLFILITFALPTNYQTTNILLIVITALFLYLSWGFGKEIKKYQAMLEKGNTSEEDEQRHQQTIREDYEKAYSRIVEKYGKEDERIELNNKRYGGIVDLILVFNQAKHILIDGLDYEWRDVLGETVEYDEINNEYTVNVQVKGFGRDTIRLETGNDKKKTKEIKDLIEEIVKVNITNTEMT